MATPNPSLLSRFSSLNVWTRGSERAPHKPLLVLYALAELQRGHERMLRFIDIDDKLKALLREFGPSQKSHDLEYSCFRLTNDGICISRRRSIKTSPRRLD